MLLLLDNYDSFTYNVYQLVSSLGSEVEVIRNDQITVEEVAKRNYEGIILSPGPGVPKDAGITEELIDYMKGRIPILGICLGHQAIGEVFGGKVVGAGEIFHGKTSIISHDSSEIYIDLPPEVEVGRYHSLVVERESLPDCLQVTAKLADGMIMGLKHRQYPIYGMQFHPESILTPLGRKMMKNYLNQVVNF
ncbi:MAG: aminodeoxychorismate/anthranilate synthase component II [Anaerovibrio sp.]|uniref:anthranilate synthase component II n=1 Tax=Anaerovibrio sp. TaxID=1872532 RepID=UPI0025D17787|nr:aminodeoxychorismate/anthranilate synthase component II [Anaerovibrio sp.]MCR5176337.1 aminodeoxychorismate/anthranilate synthase component II [Anaerovibrio sp.]